jgi:glycosyltransferase involved in cell wall biosynthesis
VRIDQWVPTLHRGDAIGDSARLMRDAFRRWGHEADVYALELDAELEQDGRRFADFRPGGPDDVVILHYALPSPLTEALTRHKGRRVLLYHNITPPEFFSGFEPEMVRICALGREELVTLQGSVDLALADSEFNRRELEQAGFGRTGVLPIFLDFARYAERPSPVMLRRLGGGTINVLFVGRLAPNKRQDDLIRVFTCWRRFITPDVRLVLVGKPPRERAYFDALQRLFYDSGLTPEEVLLLGHVDHDDLLACYRSAHVFLSMSEHEGFGVPLVEAMLLDVPILAYRATAVADTLGDAGVQFTEKRMDEIAEMGHLLATDDRLRAAVVAGQRRRLEAFTPDTVEATLRAYIDSLVAR